MIPDSVAESRVTGGREISRGWMFCAVFLLQLILMLIFGYWNASEEFEYYTIARNFANGLGFVYPQMGIDYHAYLFPIFPLLRFVLLKIFGDATWPVQLILIAFNAGSSCLAYSLSAKLTENRRAHLLAAVFVAVHPGLLFYAIGKVHWLPIGVFASFGLLLLAIRLFELPTLNGAVVFGLCLGLSYLLRPNLLLIGPAAFMAVLLFGKIVADGYWKYFLIAGFCAALAASPWWIRNRVVLGAWEFGTTTSGLQFWKGNNPGATGTNYNTDGKPLTKNVPRIVIGKRETEQNALFKREAMSYIAQDPAGFVERTGRKMFYFVWFTPEVGDTYTTWQTKVYQAYYVIVLAGILLYLFNRGNSSVKVRMILTTMVLFFIGTGLMHALCYVENRHRWICEGVLLCLASAGYAAMLEKIGLAGDVERKRTGA